MAETFHVQEREAQIRTSPEKRPHCHRRPLSSGARQQWSSAASPSHGATYRHDDLVGLHLTCGLKSTQRLNFQVEF